MRGVGLIGQRRAIKAAEPVIALGKFDRMLKMAGRKLHAIAVNPVAGSERVDANKTTSCPRARSLVARRWVCISSPPANGSTIACLR